MSAKEAWFSPNFSKTGLYFSYDGGINWTGPCTTNSFSTMRQDITGLALINTGSSTRIIAAVGVRVVCKLFLNQTAKLLPLTQPCSFVRTNLFEIDNGMEKKKELFDTLICHRIIKVNQGSNANPMTKIVYYFTEYVFIHKVNPTTNENKMM